MNLSDDVTSAPSCLVLMAKVQKEPEGNGGKPAETRGLSYTSVINRRKSRPSQEAIMKIVVIGGSGLIGSRVVTQLRQRGHEVLAASPSTASTPSQARD